MEKSERIPKQVYTEEFRTEAVKLIVEGKETLRGASKRLGIPESTLSYWVKNYKNNGSQKTGKKPVSEVEAENSRLKKEVAVLKMECEILKKATAYFVRESQKGTRS